MILPKTPSFSLNDKILIPLNSFLTTSGYSFNLFDTLMDKNVEVNSINYIITNLDVPDKINLNKYSNCLSNIFTISTHILKFK